jgi:hypothetical protein
LLEFKPLYDVIAKEVSHSSRVFHIEKPVSGFIDPKEKIQ